MPFDLRDKALTRRVSPEGSLVSVDEERAPARRHPLDSPKNEEIFNRLLDCYGRELDRQAENRSEMATDEDFYDNDQWKPDDKATLEERGQAALVYNVVATTVNWVLGTERRGRADYHILPRRKEHGEAAKKKSALLKYLADCNRTPFHRSRAFADAVKVGIGWLEDCYDDTDGQEPIASRWESWRNMLWDSTAQRFDLEDARYQFRTKWVDLDLAGFYFPDRKGVLERAASSYDTMLIGDDLGDDAMDHAERELDRIGSARRDPHRYQRRRVRIIEGWFKVPAEMDKVSGGQFAGELFDPRSRGHLQEIEAGEAEVVSKQGMRVYCALFCAAGLIYLGPSPYRHNRYPFTPIWGNKRGRDGLPYGLIRGLRSIQEDINKRASKALHLLSTKRVIADADAVEDHEEAAEEVAHSDAYIVKRKGAEFRVETDHQLADGHVELMQRDILMIQQASGVTDENLGRRTNAHSGVAIERRQTQGALTTTHYFDNLRFAFQVQGEKQLSLIEQFMTERKQFRITNMRGSADFVEINDPDLPESDIVRSKADFVISEADWRASMREAAAAELMELLTKIAPVQPQIVMVVLDLLVETMDIANREEIVRRIRKITGMSDPDADEPTPEEIAKQQAEQKAAELQQAQVMAALRGLIAKAMRDEAQAEKIKADLAKTNLEGFGKATEIAGTVLALPAVAPVADDIARDAGLVTRTEKEVALAQAAEAAQQQQQAAAQQQQAAAMEQGVMPDGQEG